MPEMTFTVRWPDGAEQDCYSPSLVVHEHLQVGERYPVADFVARSRAALTEASDRVRAKHGFACTSAAASLASIEAAAVRRSGPPAPGGDPDGGPPVVTVLAMHPPMPAPAPAPASAPGSPA